MQINLGNLIQVGLIILIIVLVVAAIQFIVILFDLRQITRRLKREIKAATFFIDALDFILAGFEYTKKKISKSRFFKNFLRTYQEAKEGGEE